jgi:hypothetical protein
VNAEQHGGRRTALSSWRLSSYRDCRVRRRPAVGATGGAAPEPDGRRLSRHGGRLRRRPVAESIDELLSERLGPTLGLDNAHVYSLADDQLLWRFQYSYVDPSLNAQELNERTIQLHKVGV